MGWMDFFSSSLGAVSSILVVATPSEAWDSCVDDSGCTAFATTFQSHAVAIPGVWLVSDDCEGSPLICMLSWFASSRGTLSFSIGVCMMKENGFVTNSGFRRDFGVCFEFQSAKSLTIPHFQPNFQIHGPVQIWKSKNSKCYYLLNYSVFVSALHMNMICVDGSKVLASKEDCLIITAISSLFEARTV